VWHLSASGEHKVPACQPDTVREAPVHGRWSVQAEGAVNSRNQDYIRDAHCMLAPCGAAGVREQAT